MTLTLRHVRESRFINVYYVTWQHTYHLKNMRSESVRQKLDIRIAEGMDDFSNMNPHEI